MGKSRKTKAVTQLDKEIARGLDSAQRELFMNLVKLTPIDTGHAQKGWKNVKRISRVLGNDHTQVIIRNDVPYIQRLDNGYSGQAPQGIVQPAISRTRKLK